jgi:CheY-specific phosphatase CheX
MSEQPITTAMADSVREVLEKMFFMDLSSAAAGDMPPDGIAAELAFEGDPPGSFHLTLDMAAAKSAAADFLGEDPSDLSEEQLNEVVCELANMICGSVLSRIESSATFRLSKPRIAETSAGAATAPEASFQAAVGGGMLRAQIRMERPVCPGRNEFAS